MKKIIASTLMLSLSFSASAREKFAGIYFDSSIPSFQIQILKDDLSYLYKSSIKDIDTELKPMMELSKVDGAHVFNWVFNRVKYIIGEDYRVSGRNLVTKRGHQFPSTPLPPSILNRTNQYRATLIMSNTGAELYLRGKMNKVLRGIRLDRTNVFAPSPRVGILQVGEGLFLERLLINKNIESEANRIKRLGTLFHEARHSDGNSEHIGFIHSKCPEGHALSGLEACESYSNGAYSIEATATKTLLLNCRTCSNVDKTKLTAIIADSLNRVTVRSHVKTEAQLLEEIATFQRVIDFYINLIATNPQASEPFKKELENLRAKIKVSEDQLAELRSPIKPKKVDPKPEGTFEEVSVRTSSSLMNASLNK